MGEDTATVEMTQQQEARRQRLQEQIDAPVDYEQMQILGAMMTLRAFTTTSVMSETSVQGDVPEA